MSAHIHHGCPAGRLSFADLVRRLAAAGDAGPVLAEVNDVLTSSTAVEFTDAGATVDLGGLSPFLANYLTAMVEQAAHVKGVDPPAWAGAVPPLDAPYFVTTLLSLRWHLLRVSPIPFKRRNIFVDASIGAQA